MCVFDNARWCGRQCRDRNTDRQDRTCDASGVGLAKLLSVQCAPPGGATVIPICGTMITSDYLRAIARPTKSFAHLCRCNVTRSDLHPSAHPVRLHDRRASLQTTMCKHPARLMHADCMR